jgi:hypothetical protein
VVVAGVVVAGVVVAVEAEEEQPAIVGPVRNGTPPLPLPPPFIIIDCAATASRLPTGRLSRGCIPPMKLALGTPEGALARTTGASGRNAAVHFEGSHGVQLVP